MSEREGVNEAPKEGSGAPKQRNSNIYVNKNRLGAKKPGKDRRIGLRNKQFDENLYRKMEGQEVPKTLRVSKIWGQTHHFPNPSYRACGDRKNKT